MRYLEAIARAIARTYRAMTMRFRYLNLNLQAAARVGFGAAMMAGTGQGRLTADLPARAVHGAKRTAQERCGSSDTSWSLSAIWPSSGSELAFSFCIALLRCTFTVASAMPISWAICLLSRPRAT